MSINTVTGKIEKKDLKITLPHEHIIIDLRAFSVPDDKYPEVFEQKLSMENRYAIFSNPYAIKDNAVYKDKNVMLRELQLFKAAGGGSIVEVTLDSIGRDPVLLKELSLLSGVNIIMGCGRYVDAVYHKNSVVDEDALAAEMISDIEKGVRDTGICAGVIGEIGTSAIISKNEWAAVRAAGKASIKTGKAIHVHIALWENSGDAVSDELLKMGVRANKICINHIDVLLREDYTQKLLDKGIYVEFDNFGKEYYMTGGGSGVLQGRFAYDLERCQLIAKLIKMDHTKQILLTNDICLKSLLSSYGGNGYAHVLNNIVPMLKSLGVKQSEIDTMLIHNPGEFLD